MTGLRVDKWLWAARFFKTRSLAAKACELGRIESGEAAAKPARDVKPGDMLKIRNDTGDFVVEVLGISEIRGSAAVAQTLYRETDASREMRQKVADQRKLQAPFEREGRPSKRDRRVTDKLRRR